MAKYRLLTLEELKELEKEFVDFLILNGIAADDWEKMKKENHESAEKIVELFSDVVFESIFRKVEYLDFHSTKEIRSFHCLADKIVLVGIKAPEESNADFTNPDYIRQTFQHPQENFKVYTLEKEYKLFREQELFQMTQTGCVISDGKTFKAICLAFPSAS